MEVFGVQFTFVNESIFVIFRKNGFEGSPFGVNNNNNKITTIYPFIYFFKIDRLPFVYRFF